VTSHWTRRQLACLVSSPATTARAEAWPRTRALPDLDLWDPWPIQHADGSVVMVGDQELWMALSAPALGHPETRHDVARLRLLATSGGGWDDLGPAFAPGASPGSREWSGSAVRRVDGTVSVFYTATGERGEPRRTYIQRVMEARARLLVAGGRISLAGDGEHREVVRCDRSLGYLPADELDGAPGRIRAFRDPGWFRDPADGREYLLVAASVPWRDTFTGAVAIARAGSDGWSLLAPVLVADGINHELERPHIVAAGSSYYLFFSTSRRTFHPPDAGPTGLYGFVSPHPLGPYEPLNDSGLVLRNPSDQPDQAYGWLVLSDLRVAAFLDYRSSSAADPRDGDPESARAAFGGTIAPTLQLAVDGARTSTAP
jgi:levansucrase